MNRDVLSIAGPVVFIPVRHHSPACARIVRNVADRLRPAAVLIEGPSDFNDQIGELGLSHTLPIAIYSYVRLGEGDRRGAFYPFCEHSPEWEALRAARDHGAVARFIDLPWAELAAADQPAHRYADGELRESPYIPTLCEKLGLEDFDALWDTLIEIDGGLDTADMLERIHTLCYHIRAASTHIAYDDLRREVFMVEQIRQVRHLHEGPVMVVTGGFYSYALFAALNGLPSPEHTSDAAPFRPSFTQRDSAEAPAERGIALTPYTDMRLDSLTGYNAGMPSPGFYRRVWRDRAIGQRDTYRMLLAEAVQQLRKQGQIASTADLIAVETGACTLAALRGHAEVWRLDLIDAIVGGLIKEAIDPDTRHPFLDALLTVFRGRERGRLADGASLPPLVYNIRRQLHEHELEPDSKERSIRLDLLAPAELARSRVLHQLRVLGIHGFRRAGGADLVGRVDLTDIWEQWQIVWSPDFEAACIESAIYGATLAEAAQARLLEQAATIERSAERAALLLLDACLMGIGERASALLDRLIALIHEDGDFLSVGAALGHLLYLYRYDAALGAAGRSDIGALLVEVFRRALWLLETIGQLHGRDKELLTGVRALVQTFESSASALALDREVLVEVLVRTGADAAQRPLLRGAATGALWTLRAADETRVRADLSSCSGPDQLGDFLTGLFALARETVQRHPELVLSIDGLLLDYTNETFLHALPALRLAFSFFTPREKYYMAQTLLESQGQAEVQLPELEVGVEVAARAMALEGWLLAEFGRYGIRWGQ